MTLAKHKDCGQLKEGFLLEWLISEARSFMEMLIENNKYCNTKHYQWVVGTCSSEMSVPQS